MSTFRIKYCFTLLLALISVSPLITRPLDADSDKRYTVKWIASFSDRDQLNIKTGFFKKLKNLIFGGNEFSLMKPVNIIARDTNHFFLIDQGLNNPVYINREDDVFEIPESEELIFPSLAGCAALNDRQFLFTDSKDCLIYMLDSKEMKISKLNDSLVLSQPTGIAFNKLKNEIIVSETSEHRLSVLNMKGAIIKTIGSRGKDSAEFNFPTYLTCDDSGYLYVVDALNFRVQIFDENYNIRYIFGDQGDSPGYISSPKGIALDSHGHIYLVDAMFNVVQIFDRKGNFLYTFGGQGREPGKFWMPSGIFIDKNNFIYIADSYNSRIQIFRLFEDE